LEFSYCNLNFMALPSLRLTKSFNRAFSGLVYAFKQEPNLRIQTAFGIIVLFIASLLQVTIVEFIILLLSLIFLIIIELVNTAFERVVDIIHPRVHAYAGVIKDLMAGAVLLSGVVAFIVSVWIIGRNMLL